MTIEELDEKLQKNGFKPHSNSYYKMLLPVVYVLIEVKSNIMTIYICDDKGLSAEYKVGFSLISDYAVIEKIIDAMINGLRWTENNIDLIFK